jgi:pimeloyl-ACP methyl ester carboxylesterase
VRFERAQHDEGNDVRDREQHQDGQVHGLLLVGRGFLINTDAGRRPVVRDGLRALGGGPVLAAGRVAAQEDGEADQAASANLNPWTEAKVDSKNPGRGPLLFISGEKDNTVPWAIADASYKKQKRNDGATEIVEIPGRGHALTVDSGWREVADTALAFVRRFA